MISQLAVVPVMGAQQLYTDEMAIQSAEEVLPGPEEELPEDAEIYEEDLFAEEPFSETEEAAFCETGPDTDPAVETAADGATETETCPDPSAAYARDEDLFSRYYDSLEDFDVPSLPENAEDAEDIPEELTGAYVPDRYLAPRLTPVRDQGTSNMCWVFSTAAILEISLLNKYPDEDPDTLDLSEEQLAYFYFNRQNDPLENTGDMHMVYQLSDEATSYREAAGSPIYLLQELSTGQGIARESDVPFYLTRQTDPDGTVSYQESSALPSAETAYLSYANLDSYDTFDYSVDKVKEEILEHGAVAVAMYYDNASRNLETNGYFSSLNRRTNHVVTLVGWDDSYATSNFNRSTGRPDSPGAWIVRNSWGDDWGENGYFYISYENATMLGCVSVSAIRSAENSYPNLYFYDGLAMVGNSCCIDPLSAVSGVNATAGANVFEVKAGDGLGEAIGEISLCTWTRDARYKVSVYTDLLDTDCPTKGRLALCQTVQMDGAGLCTFELKKEIPVSAGSWYSIVVENVGTGTESFSAQRRQLISGVLFETDNLYARSLVRTPDGSWTDLAEDGDGEVLRIRAATRTLDSAIPPCKVFTDVLDPKHAYYDAIYWAADRGIAGGYKDGSFGISRSCTRGEAIRFLWCFAGKPEPLKESGLKFTDVPRNDPFYKAILWAYQEGITKGYSDGSFGRNIVCTRGHIMMFLWKYLGRPAPVGSASSPFKDVSPKHAYYKAILYGAQNGITKGYKNGNFGINDSCTRGQIIKFLYNIDKL